MAFTWVNFPKLCELVQKQDNSSDQFGGSVGLIAQMHVISCQLSQLREGST